MTGLKKAMKQTRPSRQSKYATRHSAFGRPVADEYGIEIEPDLARFCRPMRQPMTTRRSGRAGTRLHNLPGELLKFWLDCHGPDEGGEAKKTEIEGAVRRTPGQSPRCYGSLTAQGQCLDKAVDRAHRHRPQPDDQVVDAEPPVSVERGG
jgi:hypothetical protein